MRTRLTALPKGLWWTFAVTAALLVGVVAVSVSVARSTAALDPENPQPGGAQALARVLSNHGVDVVVARGLGALLDGRVDSDTTVFLSNPAGADRLVIADLLAYAQGAARVVVAGPATEQLTALGVEGSVGVYPAGDEPATDCGTPDVRSGERLSWVDRGIEMPEGSEPAGCYLRQGVAAYVRTPATAERTEVVVIADAGLLTNERIADGDQAAMVLRALGHTRTLIWYVPVPGDVGGLVIQRALPPWLTPALWLTAVAVGTVMVWRGRRLGPLVREPLPVVVRAVETTQSRGAMYRKARAVDRGAQVFQNATSRRLRSRVGLGPGADTRLLALRVADLTGRDAAGVESLLAAAPPPDEAGFARLAQDLAHLEHDLAHRTDQPRKPSPT
jgi:hypothetical protein